MNVNFGTYGKYWEKNVIRLFNYIKYFNVDQNYLKISIMFLSGLVIKVKNNRIEN